MDSVLKDTLTANLKARLAAGKITTAEYDYIVGVATAQED